MSKDKKPEWTPFRVSSAELVKEREDLQDGYDKKMEKARSETSVRVMHPMTGVIMDEADFNKTYRNDADRWGKEWKVARAENVARKAIEAVQIEAPTATHSESINTETELAAALAQPAVQQAVEAA